jgi:hypothetical protein
MGVMMWLMMRGHHGQQHRAADPNTVEEINRLRAEIALLKQDRIAETDRRAGTDRDRPEGGRGDPHRRPGRRGVVRMALCTRHPRHAPATRSNGSTACSPRPRPCLAGAGLPSPPRWPRSP